MESEEKERILKAVASYEEDMTTTLIELINIPSISEDLKSLEKGLDYILDLAERLGFHSEKVLDGQIGIVEIGHGEEVLGILAHVDVVPPATGLYGTPNLFKERSEMVGFMAEVPWMTRAL